MTGYTPGQLREMDGLLATALERERRRRLEELAARVDRWRRDHDDAALDTVVRRFPAGANVLEKEIMEGDKDPGQAVVRALTRKLLDKEELSPDLYSRLEWYVDIAEI